METSEGDFLQFFVYVLRQRYEDLSCGNPGQDALASELEILGFTRDLIQTP